MFKTWLGVGILFLLVGAATPAGTGEYEELGTIAWLRDYDRALALAARENRPVLILFQEVPGCATCKNYGLRVLSHPLLAEAAESLFIPCVVFNNRGGDDARVLQLFREPAWNNPVVRIVDHKGQDIVTRVAGDYSPAGFSGAMITALTVYGREIPPYLDLVHTEFAAGDAPERAVLSMFCFWEGELELGSIEGVFRTSAGFIGGREAVEVEFDSKVVSFEQLVEQAHRVDCADGVYPATPQQRAAAGSLALPAGSEFRQDAGDTKYYLAHTPYRYVPLTELQQIRVNRALSEHKDPGGFLSPRQQQIFTYVKNHPGIGWKNRVGTEDIRATWAEVWAEVSGG